MDINFFEEDDAPDNNLILLNPRLRIYRLSLQLSRLPCTIDTYRPLEKQLIYSLCYISINYQLYIPATLIFAVAPCRVGSQLRSRKMLCEERSSVRAWRSSETCYGDLTCSLNYTNRDLLRMLFGENDSSKQNICMQ